MLKLYPNPCTDEVMAEFSGEMTGIPTCIDVMGRIMPITFEKVQNGVLIHMNNAPDGIYFLSLNTKESKWTGRILVLNHTL
jgi:hypothetical protein